MVLVYVRNGQRKKHFLHPTPIAAPHHDAALSHPQLPTPPYSDHHHCSRLNLEGIAQRSEINRIRRRFSPKRIVKAVKPPLLLITRLFATTLIPLKAPVYNPPPSPLHHSPEYHFPECPSQEPDDTPRPDSRKNLQLEFDYTTDSPSCLFPNNTDHHTKCPPFAHSDHIHPLDKVPPPTQHTPNLTLPSTPTHSDLVMYSQNLAGMRSTLENTKLDIITGMMIARGIDAYLLQETWLEGTFTKEVNGFLFLHHGLPTRDCPRGRRGVGIVLSPRLRDAYEKNGSPPPVIPTHPDELGRLISINFKVTVPNNPNGSFARRRKRHHPQRTITIASVYHPYKADEQFSFYDFLEGFYSSLKPNLLFFSGQDLNADVGTFACRNLLLLPQKLCDVVQP